MPSLIIQMYDHLTWTKSKFVKNLNDAMAKSLAITTCIPSYPQIPTPMWATWIMLTSLAPSPMLKVIFLTSSFIKVVTCKQPILLKHLNYKKITVGLNPTRPLLCC
jgi:hypothetical protein